MGGSKQILLTIPFSPTSISCGNSDEGGSSSCDDTSSNTTISSYYNSTTSNTSVFGTSLFNSSYYGD